MKINYKFFLIFLLLVGILLRFYNLNWGAPFYFHPDERNIASSVAQLNFPNQMHPHFFAYGSFPIYLIYFTGFFVNLFSKSQDLFIQAIFISRFYSAILSSLTIFLVYFIGTKLLSKQVGILAAVFSAFSVGLIQFAHFGTFEIWLTFFAVLLFYLSLKLMEKMNLKKIILIGIILGLLLATKISSLPLILIPAISMAFINFKTKYIALILTTYCIALIVFIITSPFVFLDFPSFQFSIKYESSVAIGTLPVFYTGEFFGSVPILFQFTKIYPFLLNPLMTILFILSLVYLVFLNFKNKSHSYFLLITSYLLLFTSQSFLFAKWTRYIVPTLPFIYLIIAIAIESFLKKHVSSIKYYLLCVIVFINFIFAASYLITVFAKQDTRIKASLWVKENIPPNANAISEVYDMGIVPFNSYLLNIHLFNFYDLDNGLKAEELDSLVSKSDYIILPSNRILKTRLMNHKKFPNANKFYTALFNNQSGFKKIYQTPCDMFCKITYLGNPVFGFEQTTNVFDRPTVFIFKKSNLKNEKI